MPDAREEQIKSTQVNSVTNNDAWLPHRSVREV